jgi:hypothetical protein
MLAHGSPGHAVVAATSAEALLAKAVILSAMRDLRSRRPDIRTEAEAWVQDLGAITVWAEALGVDPEVLQHALQRAVQREGA